MICMGAEPHPEGVSDARSLGYVCMQQAVDSPVTRRWGLKIAFLDCIWGTLLFTAVGAGLAELEKVNAYRRLAD